uniref:Uncharacterized protein n=1 Tax=Avena sativa TaxID=4498 RepID=A0ACD6A6U7_AVESA
MVGRPRRTMACSFLCEEQQQVESKPVPELQHLHAQASSDLLFEDQQLVGGGTASSKMPVLQHLHAEASSDVLCEEKPQVGGTASSQNPVPKLQHHHAEAASDLLCEELAGQTASSQMLQEQDVSSLKDLLNTATLDGLCINAASSSSVQSDAAPSHCLSSLPIWDLNRSLQQAYNAIDCYLEERRDTTMFMDQPGVSRVDKVVRQCLCWPDGTRKKRLESEPIDEKRDWMRQLVQTLVDKYNDYNHLLGDVAYEVKDVVRFQTVQGASDPSRMHYHINLTTKTKGALDSTCAIDDLFFAEVTFKRGDAELVVSCFCTVKSTDNGCCHGCDVKHPNDAATYTGGQVSPLDEYTKLGPIDWTGYNETLEEEERREA